MEHDNCIIWFISISMASYARVNDFLYYICKQLLSIIRHLFHNANTLYYHLYDNYTIRIKNGMLWANGGLPFLIDF